MFYPNLFLFLKRRTTIFGLVLALGLCLGAMLGTGLQARAFQQQDSLAKDILAKDSVDESSPALKDSVETITCYHIARIEIKGNKRTRRRLFLQEMESLKKDSIYCLSNWKKVLDKQASWFYGLGIFDKVELTHHLLDSTRQQNNPSDTTSISLLISVIERWNIIAYPILSLAPHKFNYWFNQLNGNLSYLSYGAEGYFLNLSGVNDRLHARIVLGNSPNIYLNYEGPYKVQKNGFRLGYRVLGYYTQVRSLVYDNNDLSAITLIRDDLSLRHQYSTWGGVGELRLRPTVRSLHSIYGGYAHEQIDTLVHNLRPDYLDNGATNSNGRLRRVFFLGYRFSLDKRKQPRYPIKGSLLVVGAERSGLGIFNEINFTELRLRYAHYFNRPPSAWDISTWALAHHSFPIEQAFVDRLGININSIFRGYQRFFIQGPSAVQLGVRLRRNIVKWNIPMPRFMVKILPFIPIHPYAYIYANAAWIGSYPDLRSRLNDTLIYGTGIGLDVVTIFDYAIGVHYAFTRHGQAFEFTILLGDGY